MVMTKNGMDMGRGSLSIVERAGRKIGSRLALYLRPDESDHVRMQSGVAAILAQKSARPTFRHLWDAEVSVFSQWGEDGILDYLCDAGDLPRPRALELGAGNFCECNTRFLAEYRGGAVLAVDGRDDLVSTVASNSINWRTTVVACREWITPDNVPQLMARAHSTLGGVDVISLDIDGNDFWVAEQVDVSDASIVVVEYNPLFGATQAVSVPRDDNFDRQTKHFSCLYYGASLRAFVDLFAASGLIFAGTNRVGNNAFFVKRPVANQIHFDLPDMSNLKPYVDWRVRESRDQRGELSYLTGTDRIDAIGHLPVVNTITGELASVRECVQGPGVGLS